MNIVDKILVDPITRGLKFFTKGGVVVSQSPVGMSDQLATQLGLKQYLHGTTYNGGNAPTVTLTAGGGTLSSVTRAVFVPYQMQDGSWRMRFNFNVVLSSATRTFIVITINGVTFKAGDIQPCAGITSTAVTCYATNATGTVEFAFTSTTTTTTRASGDVELDSKPTWAY